MMEMEQRAVPRSEIISDLEDIVEEVKSGKYSSVTLLQSLLVGERRVSNLIFESCQTGKQITIILGREATAADGN